MGSILQVSYFEDFFEEPLGDGNNSKIWEISKIFANIAHSFYYKSFKEENYV